MFGDREKVKECLPEERDRHRLPRQWIIDVIHTNVGEELSNYVGEMIKKRNDDLADKRHLLIELDPAIAKAFESSINISSKCCSSASFKLFSASLNNSGVDGRLRCLSASTEQCFNPILKLPDLCHVNSHQWSECPSS